MDFSFPTRITMKGRPFEMSESLLLWHETHSQLCEDSRWPHKFQTTSSSGPAVYQKYGSTPSGVSLTTRKMTCYLQRTWPKWMVPYRLWRFSHKFEHPKSTPYYSCLPLIFWAPHVFSVLDPQGGTVPQFQWTKRTSWICNTTEP